MKTWMKRLLALALAALLGLTLALAEPAEAPEEKTIEELYAEMVEEDGEYLSADEVVAYLVTFGRLPKNFLTKREAQDLGWVSTKGNLWDVAPGCAIGGDYFGNREGLLPKEGHYTECDVDFKGGFRDACRLIFDNSRWEETGEIWIWYTEDHYKTFLLMYPEEEEEN